MKVKIVCPSCDHIYEIEEPTPDTINIFCPYCDSGLPIDARDFDITQFILESHRDEDEGIEE